MQPTIATPLAPVAPFLAKTPRRITWPEFEKKYLHREDGYKYEWVNGSVEKVSYAMNPTQLYLQRNLQDLFVRLKIEGKVVGQLLAEPDLFFAPDIHRRPDFAWLTDAQIDHLAEPGVIEIPAFVIEIISTHDAALKLVDKMRHYREAGVQVVWQVYPQPQEIHVYSGQRLRSMTVCTDESNCSAAPAVAGFDFPAAEVFRKNAQ
jgi:Uma2 family endonuclease